MESHEGQLLVNIDPTQIYYRQWLLSRFHRADLPLRLVSTPTLLALDTSSTPPPGLNQPRALFGELSGLIYGLPSHPGVLCLHLRARMLVEMRDAGKQGREETQRGAVFVLFTPPRAISRMTWIPAPGRYCQHSVSTRTLRFESPTSSAPSAARASAFLPTPTPLDPAIGSHGVIHVTVAHPSPYTPRPAPRSGPGPFPRSYELTACRRMLLVSPSIAALPRLAPLSSRIMRMSLQAGATVGARPNGWSMESSHTCSDSRLSSVPVAAPGCTAHRALPCADCLTSGAGNAHGLSRLVGESKEELLIAVIQMRIFVLIVHHDAGP
ncbi:hypothetical protein FB451DRAFT_1570689 [Mycena latifolia]|nr:hypothetical protein FB451DRAFT_1570689 [Mycena latifolia]